MSKGRRRPAPATKADAMAEVVRLERRVRSLERHLAKSKGRAESGLIWRFDGEVFPPAADYGVARELKEFWERNPIRPGRDSVTGRAALERRTVQIPDAPADPEYRLAEAQKVGGYRTLLGVPMLREGVLIGVSGESTWAAGTGDVRGSASGRDPQVRAA